MTKLLPVSVIIPTANRSKPLYNTLVSIGLQTHQPQEIIIIDGSKDDLTGNVIKTGIEGLSSKLIYERAIVLGAATQRNQGISKASCDVIGFMDDDIFLEPDCIINLWNVLKGDSETGGVNAIITNQHYQPPHYVTRLFYQLMMGKRSRGFGGQLFGPVINMLPADDPALGDVVPVGWLNAGCTFYKKELLPQPVFDKHFVGYSFMEDLALSLRVAKKGRLYNVRTARIFHDTQPGFQKNNVQIMAEMDLVNRYYIMRNIMMLKGVTPYLKLILHQLYFAVITKSIFKISFLKGKYNGVKKILKGASK
jgi:GT2 family glycosyltransferase